MFFDAIDHFGMGGTDMLNGILYIFGKPYFRIGAKQTKGFFIGQLVP
jgi:hypothetical protein